MSGRLWIGMVVAGVLGLGFAGEPLAAQEDGAGEVLIGIYRVAPGKQMDFLRWQAQQEAIAAEAGAPATQWYAHLDGDSWDFVSIQPVPADEDAVDEKIQSLAKAKGLPTGAAAGMAFRQFIASHTDTFAAGPMTAAQLVEGASSR